MTSSCGHSTGTKASALRDAGLCRASQNFPPSARRPRLAREPVHPLQHPRRQRSNPRASPGVRPILQPGRAPRAVIYLSISLFTVSHPTYIPMARPCTNFTFYLFSRLRMSIRNPRTTVCSRCMRAARTVEQRDAIADCHSKKLYIHLSYIFSSNYRLRIVLYSRFASILAHSSSLTMLLSYSQGVPGCRTVYFLCLIKSVVDPHRSISL